MICFRFLFDYTIRSFSLLATANNDNLYLKAYDSGDNLVASHTQYVTMGSWQTMAIDLAGVSATKIRIHNTGNYFGYDDITYTPIPEPSTLLLLGSGLLGLGVFARYRRNKKA